MVSILKLHTPVPAGSTTCILLCIPWAGGNGGYFRSWVKSLALIGRSFGKIQLLSLNLEGRSGANKALEHDMKTIIADTMNLLQKHIIALCGVGAAALNPPKIVIFGHSLGGMIAYELARACDEEGGLCISHLLLSAILPPCTLTDRNRLLRINSYLLSEAPTAELRAHVISLGGLTEGAMSVDMETRMLRVIRADYRLFETYQQSGGNNLCGVSMSMTIISGTNDILAPPNEMRAWTQYTKGSELAAVVVYPDAGHFYLLHNSEHLHSLQTHLMDACVQCVLHA